MTELDPIEVNRARRAAARLGLGWRVAKRGNALLLVDRNNTLITRRLTPEQIIDTVIEIENYIEFCDNSSGFSK
jgi:hypothetical protein